MAENVTPKQTIVEEGTEVEGIIRSKVAVKVSGAVKGEVAAPSLAISTGGSVKGQVKVQELKSEGEIAGQIEAESVQLSGRVNDNTAIRAASLEVKLAQSDGKLQVTFGNVELHVGERPARAEKIDASPAAAPSPKEQAQPAQQAQQAPAQPRVEKR